VDLASWDKVIDRIVRYVAENWYMDRCRQEDGKEATIEDLLHRMRLDDTAAFGVKFINHDILSLPAEAVDFSGLDFITSMFTTNELFTSSRVATIKLLQRLSLCREGCLLLLVESAGSYSEVKVGSKVFPVQFLIHHTLTVNGHWALLNGNDSRWYRVPDGLEYPMRLENMRHFYRLYQRTAVQ
jgi:25S rRNA (uracil2843-N3)-methyltransferase